MNITFIVVNLRMHVIAGRDVTVPSGTGPRPGPDRDRTKLHGTTVWSGHGPRWSGPGPGLAWISGTTLGPDQC